jgi:predicted RNase H-like nuclease (RuvC/YqgF family)
MLLNEFLKEHRNGQQQDRKIEELEATVAKLESAAGQQKDLQTTVARQQEQIERLTAALKDQANQIQKVSDQVQASKAAAQLVASDQ